MRKEDREIKVSQTQMAGLKIVFASIFMGASLLLDLYAMINYSGMLWLIAILSLVFVAGVYFFSSSIMQIRFSERTKSEELYDDLLKSSKATYLMMKKSFEEIQQQLDDMEDKMAIPQEEIINAQKSIAKITISRNKENTDALMNSNDHLLEKIFDFEDQIDKLENKLAAQQKASTTEAIQEVLLKQQELSNLLKEVEIALKKDILSVSSRIQSQPVMMTSAPIPVQSNIQETFEQPEISLDDSEFSNDVLDDLIAQAEAGLDRQAAVDEPIVEPDFLDEPVVDLESDMVADDLLVESLMDEQPGLSLEPEIEEEPVIEPELEIPVEPEVEEEPVIEPELEIPVEPEVAEEPVIELEPEIPAEPEVMEEPAQEEKPPMPDLSDPNHVMTPDEIAALLANM